MEVSAGTRRPMGRWAAGFTLIELLVAAAVLCVIMLLALQLVGGTSAIWQRTRAKIDTFHEARGAFDAVTANLSQATLNVYLDYVNASGEARSEKDRAKFEPVRYARASELQFQTGRAEDLLPEALDLDGGAIKTVSHAVFFQAPLGRKGSLGNGGGTAQLLNACGYFLEYSSDRSEQPLFLQASGAMPERRRFRLVEFVEPAERLRIYETAGKDGGWFREALKRRADGDRRVLAQNVIALILLPVLSPGDPLALEGRELAPDYAYDSRRYLNFKDDRAALTRNQLPPLVRVTMVCADEKSMARLEQRRGDGSAPPDFGLGSLFQTSDSEEGYRRDLETLEKNLNKERLTYRVFSTVVSIAQAKWNE